MDSEQEPNMYDDIVVAESALLKRDRPSRYGSVPDLDDSELAEPDELERQVLRQEFAPVLALPVKRRRSGIRPGVDENGQLDWGAFGTVDFDRYGGGFDKARYKADIVKEELRDLMISFSMVSDRIQTRAKYLILKYLRMDIIQLEHIIDNDMLALAKLFLRARQLRREMVELREASRRRRLRKAEAMWGP